MRIFCTILFMYCFSISYAQRNHALHVICNDKPTEFFSKKLSYRPNHKDSVEGAEEAMRLFGKLKSQGYLAASVDSLIADSLQTTLHIYVGEKFDNIIVKNGNIDMALLGNAGVKGAVLTGKKISIGDAEIVKAKVIRECENSGYPFASIKLDSFMATSNFFTAKLFLEKNEIIKYDSIHIFGKTRLKRAFLKNYLGLRLNKHYNENNIQRISQRLAELPFVDAIQARTVEFVNGKAKVNLYLKDKRASRFDLLIGLLPGSSGKKLLVTGEATIHLVSLLGMGEEFYLQWKSLQPKTQQLDVRFTYPYLIGLPLGISARFELYKRDTWYLDLNGDYGIQYQIIGSNYVKASLMQHNTIITNVDTAYIKQTRRLPKFLDLNTNEFALEYFMQKLNYRFNPISGYTFRIGGSAGVKKIRRNNNITGLQDELRGGTFAYLYDDSIRLKTFQFRISLMVEKYWKLASRHTIKTNFEGKYFYAQTIFDNEKYRLGGTSSLRGFDDQSIFTPYYAMANVEYRFLLSKNSYFSTFFNAALVQESRAGKGLFDFPYGFGAGAAIETKAGIFGITYAMGTQLDNKITIKSAKIHIGYINYF